MALSCLTFYFQDGTYPERYPNRYGHEAAATYPCGLILAALPMLLAPLPVPPQIRAGRRTRRICGVPFLLVILEAHPKRILEQLARDCMFLLA
jgi:hypothetical protein